MTRFARFGKTRVKICCIRSVDEAVLAIRYGASALGLVADMPSGPRVIPEELISKNSFNCSTLCFICSPYISKKYG